MMPIKLDEAISPWHLAAWESEISRVIGDYIEDDLSEGDKLDLSLSLQRELLRVIGEALIVLATVHKSEGV
jgi:hypothetical protein